MVIRKKTKKRLSLDLYEAYDRHKNTEEKYDNVFFASDLMIIIWIASEVIKFSSE